MKLTEINKNLFNMYGYAFAHCISADFALGAGIAKEFDRRYDCRKYLFGIFEKSWIPRWDKTQVRYRGGCIPVFADNNVVIFNLVTKRNYWDKPTLATLEEALCWMKEQCEVYHINKVAMPRIGCGLDRLNWSDVKPLIEKVFKDTDIEIVVCNL